MKNKIRGFIKGCIWMLDEKFTHGQFRRKWFEVDKQHAFLLYGKSHYIEKMKSSSRCSKLLRIPVCDLVFMQLYDHMRFLHWNIIVHYMFLEYLDGKNDCGEKFERILSGDNRTVSYYRELVQEIRKKGFDRITPLEVNQDMVLIDGAFRLALAIYDGIDFLPVFCNNTLVGSGIIIGKDKMRIKGFSPEQLKEIEKKLIEILDFLRYYNTCIIWPPVRGMFDELVAALNDYDSDNIKVHDFYDTTMSFDEIKGFIEIGYKKDDAISEALRKKSDYMKLASAIEDNVYPVRFVRLAVKNPNYIVKSISGMPYAQEALRCKETFRTLYKSRVNNYERDVIIHISDNYLQSQYIWQLAHVKRDITKWFTDIKAEGINYRLNNFYGSQKNGRYIFFLGYDSNLSLTVSSEDENRTFGIIESCARSQFQGKWLEVKSHNRAIDIYLENEKIFAIKILVEDAN